MEVKIQRSAYYFSWPDEEILDEKLLGITGDDETWLYRVERDGYNGHFQIPIQTNHYHTPSGSVDSRTFTRRKHPLRPSLESVAESPLSIPNRSSLGILTTSLLNDTKLGAYSITPISTSQGRTFSSFIDSNKAPIPRVFKLDTPFMNAPFERRRNDSELSDSSIIPSLDSQFDKNEAMTDSLVNFLEKPNEKCQPPSGFQDDKPMTESLVSLSDKESALDFNEEAMTESMVDFLEPVTCRPPSGFGDDEMNRSLVNIDEKDILPTSDMTNSLMDYLESGQMKTTHLTQSITCNEAENIPPERLSNREEEFCSFKDRLKNSLDENDVRKINSTFELKKDGTFNLEDSSDKSPEIQFTNITNVNITKSRNELIEEPFTRPINTTFEKENGTNNKSRALNNKDLNVTRDFNDEDAKVFNLSRFQMSIKTNSSTLINSTRLNSTFKINSNDNSEHINGTFIKSSLESSQLNGLNRTTNISRQIPQRNSTFNTTFTKLDSLPKDLSRNVVSRSTECLDMGVEDDRTSSASDSSFSSAASSSKPRSVDELRTIAQQQESNLAHSTPENDSVKNLGRLDLTFSPIKRSSMEGKRVSESRSAHCSPVRSPAPHAPRPHPVSRLKQPVRAMDARRQALQASSLCNLSLARAGPSGLHMPQPMGRMSLARPALRPTTAPAPGPGLIHTAIPRPQASRLPMPRVRASGIPQMKRGGRH